jgi:hypothetical protein
VTVTEAATAQSFNARPLGSGGPTGGPTAEPTAGPHVAGGEHLLVREAVAQSRRTGNWL